MDIQDLLTFVAQYGYAGLFFSLWLGIVGLPLPDEAIVMSGGLLSSLHALQPVPAFLLTYLGVVSGLSLGYAIGRALGAGAMARLARKTKPKYIERATAILDKYGHFALVVSYFIPVVRHVLPYIVGTGRMPFRLYALYSYTTGFAWTAAYFACGYFFGKHIGDIGALATEYGLYFGLAVACLAALYALYKTALIRNSGR